MTRPFALLAACLMAAACARPAGAAPAPDAGGHHVVIVSVDGLRPDAITPDGTPALARLLREGAATLASRVPHPSRTLPGHFSMVTGQTAARHGITTNKILAREPVNATLFTAVHDTHRRTALYIGKHKLVALAPRGSADVVVGPGPRDRDWAAGASARLAERFAADFPRERFALTLLHLREGDEAGHDDGWMTPRYLAALAEADRALDGVLRAIAGSGLPTTVFLTSDHGGSGTQHWSKDPLDSTVPWICAGPGVTAGAALAAPRLQDIAPTAAALLGVTLPEVEGKVVKECLSPQ